VKYVQLGLSNRFFCGNFFNPRLFVFNHRNKCEMDMRGNFVFMDETGYYILLTSVSLGKKLICLLEEFPTTFRRKIFRLCHHPCHHNIHVRAVHAPDFTAPLIYKINLVSVGSEVVIQVRS
jgi:hypothetical protein